MSLNHRSRDLDFFALALDVLRSLFVLMPLATTTATAAHTSAPTTASATAMTSTATAMPN